MRSLRLLSFYGVLVMLLMSQESAHAGFVPFPALEGTSIRRAARTSVFTLVANESSSRCPQDGVKALT